MSKLNCWIGCILCIYGMISAVNGGSIYVSVSGDDGWDGQAAAWDGTHGPKKTIQAGIDASSSGDTVQASPGVYPEIIDFKGKSICLTSNDPSSWSIVESTVIQGNGAGSVVTFANSETRDAVLTGFTITGGFGTWNDSLGQALYIGGGIYCFESSPTIYRNIIRDNAAPRAEPFGYGGGIGSLYSDAKITCNILSGNEGDTGGGACCLFGDFIFQNNMIINNSAAMAGGAVFIDGQILNNTFSTNQANAIGNLYLIAGGSGDEMEAAHNIIANAPAGGGVMFYNMGTQPRFSYNNVWENSGGNYLQTDDQTGIHGNISVDPLFLDAENGDYHLDVLSPCIQAGDPAYEADPGEKDIDGEDRVSYGRIDIGADEFFDAAMPAADAGEDQTHLVFPVTITLDGSGSQDPAGNPLTYTWQQITGPAVNLSDLHAVNPTFTASEIGIYEFSLVVYNGNKNGLADTVKIRVGNHTPSANAGPDRICRVGSQIYLDGADSRDEDGDMLTCTWRQLSGPELALEGADTARVGAEFVVAGDYLLELEVTDGAGAADTDTVEIRCSGMDIYIERFDPGSETLEGKYYHYSDIDGDSVIYSVGSACDYTWAIGQKNLLTGTVIRISPPGADNHPKIDNNIMVWCAAGDDFGSPWYHEPSNAGIAWQYFGEPNSYSIKTLRKWTWTESYSHPAISGRKVV